MEYSKTKQQGLCKVKFCRNQKALKDCLCPAHAAQRYKENYPSRYLYYKLKANASRRGIAFNLSRQEFENFCRQTKYDVRHGRSSNDLSVDRINSDKGYEIGNIQVLTVSQNSRKYHALESKGLYENPDTGEIETRSLAELIESHTV